MLDFSRLDDQIYFTKSCVFTIMRVSLIEVTKDVPLCYLFNSGLKDGDTE